MDNNSKGLVIDLGINVQPLQQGLQQASSAVTSFGNQLNDVKKPIGDASQSLINFSRIAQDAPYGIQGIANNLNPMVESFQRLAATEGGTKKALEAMVAGLSGPAGIGVAVGVVSSLLVVFSKKLSEMFETPTEKLKAFKEELNKLNQDIYRIVGSAQANREVAMGFSAIAGSDTESIEKRKTALKYLKDIYKDNKEIQDLTIESSTKYMNYAINRAAKQEEYLAKEKNNVQALGTIFAKVKELEDERNAKIKSTTEFLSSVGVGKEGIEAAKNKINKDFAEQIAEAKKSLPAALKVGEDFQDAISGFETPDKKGKTIIPMNYADALKIIQRKYPIKEPEAPKEKDTAIEDEMKKYKEFQNFLSDFFKFRQKMSTEHYKEEQEKIKKQNESYKQFADTLSGNVTNALISVFDTMAKGGDVLKSLGDSFLRLAEDIAASVIKAYILKAIMASLAPEAAAVNPLESAINPASGDAGTGWLSALYNITNGKMSVGSGMDTSGIITNSAASTGEFTIKGNDLVLALQRSNYNLSLKRGL